MIENHRMFLIVDDEPDMCWALKFLLQKNGVPAQTASSAGEALRLMEPHRFKMVFLDAKLPDMEGLELAKRLREIDPAVRLVMISGYYYGDDEDIQKATSEGLICGFIGKPFVHDEILKAIGDDLPGGS
ncbi:MAG: response regulator [Syntrophobacteria bacterium]